MNVSFLHKSSYENSMFMYQRNNSIGVILDEFFMLVRPSIDSNVQKKRPLLANLRRLTSSKCRCYVLVTFFASRSYPSIWLIFFVSSFFVSVFLSIFFLLSRIKQRNVPESDHRDAEYKTFLKYCYFDHHIRTNNTILEIRE